MIKKIRNIILQKQLMVLAFAPLAIICFAGVGSIILTVFFGVPIGDDYSALHEFSNSHTWLQDSWYSLTHTGRYMQSVAASLAYGIFQSNVAVIVPAIAISWTYTITYLTVRRLVVRLKRDIPTIYIHAASIVLLFFFVFSGRAVDIFGVRVWLFYQPFFFPSAIVTYTFAILIYWTIAYLLITRWNKVSKKPRLFLPIFVILTYLCGLFNETTPATIFSIASITFIATFIPSIKMNFHFSHIRIYLVSSVLTSLAALTTMFLSPANIARRQATGYSKNGNVIPAILERLDYAFTSLVYRPIDILLLVSFGIIVGVSVHLYTNKRSYVKEILAGLSLVLASIISLLVGITLLVVGYGQHTGIYPRALLLVQLFFIAGVVLFVTFATAAVLSKLPDSLSQCGKLIAISLVIIINFIIFMPSLTRIANHITGVQDYNAIWLKQDAMLREAAINNPNVPVFLNDSGSGIGDGFILGCDGSWVSDVMEAYYGVRQICSETNRINNQVPKL